MLISHIRKTKKKQQKTVKNTLQRICNLNTLFNIWVYMYILKISFTKDMKRTIWVCVNMLYCWKLTSTYVYVSVWICEKAYVSDIKMIWFVCLFVVCYWSKPINLICLQKWYTPVLYIGELKGSFIYIGCTYITNIKSNTWT